MKKTFKNLDLTLISQLVLGILVLLMGTVVMIFKAFGLIDIVLYISILFYIFAVFSTITYFVKRKEGDYENLLLSLINIITGTFMFVFKKDNPAMILGAGMTIYTILIVANRGCKILLLKSQNSFMWIIKFIVTFLIGFLGMLTTFNLFKEVTVQTMMFGYYFMSLGFMLTIENVIEIFITDETFKRILSKIIEDTRGLDEIKEDNTKNKTTKTENKIDEISNTQKVLVNKIEKESKPKAKKEIKKTEPVVKIKPDKKEVKTTSNKKNETPKKNVEIKELPKDKKEAKKTEPVLKLKKNIEEKPKQKKETKSKTTASKKIASPKKKAESKITKETRTEKQTKAKISKTETVKKPVRPKKTETKRPGRPKKTA